MRKFSTEFTQFQQNCSNTSTLSKKEPISEHNTNKTDNPSSKPHEDKKPPKKLSKIQQE